MTSIPTLETPRLLLRPWQPSDLGPYAQFQADPLMRRYVGNRAPLTFEQACAEIAGFEDEWRRLGRGRWAVVERATGALVGACGMLTYMEGTPNALGELAYGYGRSSWGRGFATEAGCAALAWFFDTFDEPEAVALTTPDNVASQHVLEKLGFIRSGEARGRFAMMAFFRLSRTAFGASGAMRATSN